MVEDDAVEMTATTAMTAPSEDRAHGGDHTHDGGMSARMLRALHRGATQLVALIARDGTIVDVGESVRDLLGYEREDLLGRRAFDLLTPEGRAFAEGLLARDRQRPRRGAEHAPDAQIGGEFKVYAADGSIVFFKLTRTNMLSDPDVDGVLVVGQKPGHQPVLTEALSVLAWEPEGLEAVRQMLGFLDLEMPGTRAAVRIAGAGGEWVCADERVALLCNASGPWREAVESDTFLTADLSAMDAASLAPAVARRAADLGFKSCWCMPLPNLSPRVYPRFDHAPGLPLVDPGADEREWEGRPLGCLVIWSERAAAPDAAYLATIERVGLFVEVALRRRRDRERIRRLLHHDHLTGALSRAGMQAVIAGDPSTWTQVLIDLDDFKLVNDRYGHAVGDQVLRLGAQRITGVFRSGDRIVRLGGDEFLVMVAGTRPDLVQPALERLLRAFARPFQIGSLSVSMAISVGVAFAAADAAFEVITDRADQAMYRAKRSGKNRWWAWTPDLEAVGSGPALALE